MQDGGYPRVGRVGVFTHQGGSRAICGSGGIEHHRSRGCGRELLAIVRIGYERQGMRIRVLQRIDVIDASGRVAAQLAAETDRELPE